MPKYWIGLRKLRKGAYEPVSPTGSGKIIEVEHLGHAAERAAEMVELGVTPSGQALKDLDSIVICIERTSD